MLFHRSLLSRPPRSLPVLWIALTILMACSACSTKREITDPLTNWLLLQGTQALNHHDFRTAMAFADSALRRAPGNLDKANAFFLHGQVLSEVGRLDEADADYNKVLELEPRYRGVWNNLGDNAFRRQAYQRALNYYLKEVALSPDAVSLHGMGCAYVKLGIIDSAHYAFDQAIELDSLYLPTYLDLVLLLEEEGLWEAALQNAQKALSYDPGDLDFHYLVGSNLVRMGKGEAALSHLQLVVEAWPWHELAKYNMGRALALLGREDEAQSYLDQAEDARAQNVQITLLQESARIHPDDPVAHARLAYALSLVGRLNYAMYAYQVALQLDPDNFELLTNVANLCLDLGDTTSAILYYRDALQIQPSLVVALVNLGSIYAMLNDFEAAQKAWQTALIYDPNNSIVKEYLAKISGDPQ